MKPIEFPEQNVVFAKDQPQYLPLPAFRDSNDPEGVVVTCWGLSFLERLRLAVTGKLYFSQMTFGQPLQPQRPSVDSPFLGPAP